VPIVREGHMAPRSAASAPIALNHFTSFGDLLQYLRRRAGLTQRELATAVGYSKSLISRLERDERVPDRAALQARFVPVIHNDPEPK
jgi:DNA-binding XRE family transcriptional regulator